MMRPARRALLLVAFSLLASAARAYAECAWVAWQETTIMGSGQTPFAEWSIVHAGSSEKACAEAAASQARARAAFWKSPERTPPGGSNPNFTRQVEMSATDVRVSDSTGSVYTYHFLCLPDTVDPRGAKGK